MPEDTARLAYLRSQIENPDDDEEVYVEAGDVGFLCSVAYYLGLRTDATDNELWLLSWMEANDVR